MAGLCIEDIDSLDQPRKSRVVCQRDGLLLVPERLETKSNSIPASGSRV